jgi:hypothetical protein
VLIDLGFAVNSCVDQYPIINVELDGVQHINNLILDKAGKVDDPLAVLQQVILNVDNTDGHHCLRIQSVNISEDFKNHSDFGVQLRSVKINGTDLEWFGKGTISFNPVPGPGYIDHYVLTHNLMHEIEEHNGILVHVRRGDFANYINLPNGYIELNFVTPLYQWFLKNNFGTLTQNLILDFT